MKINYSILWFEDNQSWFDSVVDSIKDYLRDNGFKEIIKREEKWGELDKLVENGDLDKLYDLIIIDYNLAGEKGDAIINKIRDNEFFTEIIFYSQDGETSVREKVKELGADGVYCSARDNPEFDDKVKKIINTTIKKVQDVNAMRGLIMAETSDLDKGMLDIIISFSEKNKTKSEHLANYIFEKAEDFKKTMGGKLEDIKKNRDHISIVKQNLLFDSYKKAQAVQKIITLINNTELSRINKFVENYNKEVIQVRNIFAHVQESIENSNRVLISEYTGKKEIFTEERCEEIRKSLIKHSKNIDLIKSHI